MNHPIQTFGSFDELPKTPTKSMKGRKPSKNSNTNENAPNVSLNHNTNSILVSTKLISDSNQTKSIYLKIKQMILF